MRHIVVLPIDSGDPSNRHRLSPRAVSRVSAMFLKEGQISLEHRIGVGLIELELAQSPV
jgi:hypothetical protein